MFFSSRTNELSGNFAFQDSGPSFFRSRIPDLCTKAPREVARLRGERLLKWGGGINGFLNKHILTILYLHLDFFLSPSQLLFKDLQASGRLTKLLCRRKPSLGFLCAIACAPLIGTGTAATDAACFRSFRLQEMPCAALWKAGRNPTKSKPWNDHDESKAHQQCWSESPSSASCQGCCRWQPSRASAKFNHSNHSNDVVVSDTRLDKICSLHLLRGVNKSF